MLQVLFFEDEVKRSEFVNHLCSEGTNSDRPTTVTETSEKELLREAVTKEQRAEIVETFIRHAFAKVTLLLYYYMIVI